MLKRRFVKIKLNDNSIFLAWQENDNSEIQEFSFKCNTPAKESFYSSLNKLKSSIVFICGLPKDFESRTTVTGLTLSWSVVNGEFLFGSTLNGSIAIDGRYTGLNINTPFLKEDGPDPNQLLPAQTIIDIYELLDNANSYLEGDRAIEDLFADTSIVNTNPTLDDNNNQ